MKRKSLPILIITILLSACSIQKPLYSNQEEGFNIDEYNEHFEIKLEDTNINKIENKVQLDTKPKKFEGFEDTNIGFSFLYPDNGIITKDINSNSIRIQNYETGKEILNIGDFYIEIFYLKNNLNCEHEMLEITSVYENKGVTINRGLGKRDGNIFGTKYALCFKKGENLVYISYTESGNIYVNTIFNSLQIK